MGNGNPEGGCAKSNAAASASHLNEVLSLASILLIFTAGCAAPGAPIARQPAVAAGITDLLARQTGANVVLTFTLPKETVQGRPILKLPDIEIYREFLSPSAQSAPPGPLPTPQQMILEVDSQLENQYRDGARMRIPTALSPANIAAHAGEDAVYAVRTRISSRDSAESNLAEVWILPPPQPPQDLKAEVTKSAIKLSWMPVEVPPGGALGHALILYRVYRVQGGAQTPANSVAGTTRGSISLEFELLAETTSPAYNDTNFVFGQSYQYIIRSVARYESGEIESENSEPLEATPRNTFPPAAPQGLVAAVIPARGTESAHVDLSWAISPETDVVGYNIYRTEVQSAHGEKLNGELLLTPAFRDMSASQGHHYFYRVSALDRYGNESEQSAAAEIALPPLKEPEKR